MNLINFYWLALCNCRENEQFVFHSQANELRHLLIRRVTGLCVTSHATLRRHLSWIVGAWPVVECRKSRCWIVNTLNASTLNISFEFLGLRNFDILRALCASRESRVTDCVTNAQRAWRMACKMARVTGSGEWWMRNRAPLTTVADKKGFLRFADGESSRNSGIWNSLRAWHVIDDVISEWLRHINRRWRH